MSELLPAPTTAHVFLRSEVIAAGLTDRDIRAFVRSGAWHRVRRGAFVVREVWDEAGPLQRHALTARAVLMQSKTDLVLSHVSALHAYQAPTWGVPLHEVHVTRPDRRAGRTEAGVRQHRGRLREEDVVVRDDVEATSATRTALDITTVVGVEAALCVVNHLLHAGATSLEELEARYADMDRNPFTLTTDLVLRLADPRIESVGESRTFYLCWRQGVPAPTPQWVVRDRRGREVARLDFAWPERRVWVQLDGVEKYVKFVREGETVADVVLREKRREDLVRELTGWRCLRLTWADLADPVRTAARLQDLLATSAA